MTGRARGEYDVVVVGGGINGLAICRDAAIRGLTVALVERDDLGCETSSWSSRMIHGGLRYLERRDLRLVRESLREREALFRTAPHLVKPMQLYIPIFQDSTRGRALIRAGMVAYDLLSYDKSVPRHRFLNPRQTLEALPGLRRDGLRGAATYTDGQVELSERLCVEIGLDAARHGAAIMTKTTAVGIDVAEGRARAVQADGPRGPLRLPTRCVVNAAGPWVDSVIPGEVDDAPLVGGTKGSHIVLDPFPGAPASTVHFETEDGKPLLCIPWLGRLLIGSTDEHFAGDPGAVTISDEERALLVHQVNRLFPSAGVSERDVRFSYAGVRPLPHVPGKSATAITRRHHVHRHTPRAGNLFSIIGGKLTTHRSLAQEVVDQVVRELGLDLPSCSTSTERLPGAATSAELADRRAELAGLGLDDAVIDRLIGRYGSLVDRLIDRIRDDPLLGARVSPRSSVIVAEVLVAVDEEWATSLADVIFRRVVAGFDDGLAVFAGDVANLLIRQRDWSAERISANLAQIGQLASRLEMAKLSGPP